MASGETLRRLFEEDILIRRGNQPENLFRQQAMGKAKEITGRKTPEVMVKMTGAKKGAGHLKRHLSYTTREGEVKAENQDGVIIEGEQAIKETAEDWLREHSEDTLKNRRTAMSFVFSMPKGTDTKGLKEAVRQTAKTRFSNHDYIMVLHDEGVDHGGRSNPNPHIHLTVNAKGHDGKQLHLSKDDTAQLRQTFAEKLNDQGIDAKATTRRVRGVTKKGFVSSIFHMAERGAETLSEKIKTDVEQITKHLQEGREPLTVYDQRAIERQKEVRKDWVTLAKELNNEDPDQHSNFAQEILAFVKELPPIETQRQKLVAMVQRTSQEEFPTKQTLEVSSDLQSLTNDSDQKVR